MGDEEIFEVAKGERFQYGLYFNAVVQELGLDRALDFLEKASDAYGAGIVGMMKQQLGDEVSPETLVGTVSAILNRTGFETEMKVEDPTSVVLRTTKCPAYEGLLMAGLDPETIEAHCRRATETYAPYFKQLNPKLRYEIRKWAAPEGFCEEEFVLE